MPAGEAQITGKEGFVYQPLENQRFLQGKDIDPMRVREDAADYCRKVLAAIPTKDRSTNPESRDEEIKHSLVLRYPEDSHLAPILEKEMHKALQASSLQVQGSTLLGFNPLVNELEIEADDGEMVSGETHLQHEIRHAHAAFLAGQEITYIVIPFIISGESSEDIPTIKTKQVSTLVINTLEPEEIVEVAMAPKYPSLEDFLQASACLQELDEPFHPSWEELHSRWGESPRLEGQLLHANEIQLAFKAYFEENHLPL